MLRWINTPCTDPVGRVFMADGKVYRAIFPGQESLARFVLDKREVRALMDEGLIARMETAGRKVDGFGLVVESEAAPFDVPCERFTRATLQAAALRWLETYQRLQPAGLVLSDAHYGNYMLFAKNEPRWIDLGSIRPPSAVEEERPFRSFQRFWSGMLAPLVLLETQPRQSRLARLSIADQPHQGPLTTADEAPLCVDDLVKDSLRQLHVAVGELGAEAALDKLRAFVLALPRRHETVPSVANQPAAAVLTEIEEQFRSSPISSVICLGSDTFRLFSSTWGKTNALVIDDNEGELDRLGGALAHGTGSGQTALYYGHPVNRFFLKAAPSAEAVLAVDPLARFAHNSHVAAENLAHVLGALGSRIAVVVTQAGQKAETERMLRHAYPSVAAASRAWFSSGPVVVWGRK